MGRLGGITFIVAGLGVATYASPWLQDVQGVSNSGVPRAEVAGSNAFDTRGGLDGAGRSERVSQSERFGEAGSRAADAGTAASAHAGTAASADAGTAAADDGGSRVFSAGRPLLVAASRLAESSNSTIVGGAAPPTLPVASSPAPTFRSIAPQLPPNTKAEALNTLVSDIQGELARLGCGQVRATGAWDESTKAAARLFLERSNARLPLDTPDPVLRQMLELRQPGVCNAGCPSGEVMTAAGRCLPRSIVAFGAGTGGLLTGSPVASTEARRDTGAGVVAPAETVRQFAAVPSSRRTFEAPVARGWQTEVSASPLVASKGKVKDERKAAALLPRVAVIGPSNAERSGVRGASVGSLLPPLAGARGSAGPAATAPPKAGGISSPAAGEQASREAPPPSSVTNGGQERAARPRARVAAAPRPRRVEAPPYGLTKSSPRASSESSNRKSGIARRREALYRGVQFNSP